VSDEITVVMPRGRPFHAVAQLVLGGLAARLDLTLETLEELQLALAGLLERPGDGVDVTLVVRVEAASLEARVGPFDGPSLRADLGPGELGIAHLLERLVDRFGLDERDGQTWVELTKSVQAVAP
jgi:hypothetical protein